MYRLPAYLRSPAASEELRLPPESERGCQHSGRAGARVDYPGARAADGNQSQAARILRIGRDALRYKLKKHNLETVTVTQRASRANNARGFQRMHH